MGNNEVVGVCSQMWKYASDSERAPFLEEERKLRAEYHIEADKWKEQQRREKQEAKAQKENEKREREKRNTAATIGYMFPPEPPTHNALMHSSYVPAPPSASASRAKRQKKDPNAPKRSPPAFFLFVNHCRAEVKAQYPDLRHTELVKMLGRKWAAMGEEAKAPFRRHEEQLRAQYHQATKNYKKSAVLEQNYTDLPQLPTIQPAPEFSQAQKPQQPVFYNQPTYKHPENVDQPDNQNGMGDYLG